MDGGGGKQAVSSAKYQGSKWELSRVAMVSQELGSKWLLLKMAAEVGKVRRRHSLSLPPAGAEVEATPLQCSLIGMLEGGRGGSCINTCFIEPSQHHSLRLLL